MCVLDQYKYTGRVYPPPPINVSRASRHRFMGQERYGLSVQLARHCPVEDKPGIFGRAKAGYGGGAGN